MACKPDSVPHRRAEHGSEAATIHLGGTLEDIARSEAEVDAGRVSPRPFVLLTQTSLFDPTRAPAGRHAVWAYCHVPNGSNIDATEPILAQIERYAPGFRERILGMHAAGPAAISRTAPFARACTAATMSADALYPKPFGSSTQPATGCAKPCAENASVIKQ